MTSGCKRMGDLLVGVSGLNGCGKSTLAKFLRERKGFLVLSLSDVIREELAGRGLPETRQHLINMGNQLRHERGADALALMTVKKLQPNRNHVVDSIRHPEEVRGLASSGRRFILVAIDTPASLRYELLKSRQRLDDRATLEDFEKIEQQERANCDPRGQQVLKVLEMADHALKNDGSLAEFEKKIEAFARDILGV